MKEVVAYCRVACAKQSDPSAEAQRQEHMVRRYADARGLIICEQPPQSYKLPVDRPETSAMDPGEPRP